MDRELESCDVIIMIVFWMDNHQNNGIIRGLGAYSELCFRFGPFYVDIINQGHNRKKKTSVKLNAW